MSKELSLSQKSEIVTGLVNELLEAQKNVVMNFLVIGRILTRIQKEKLWASYGEHIKKFEDFLKEVRFARSTAYHTMAIYQNFGEYLESHELDVPFRRLIKLLPVAKENKEEWLKKAETLTENDFEGEIRKAQGKVPYWECEHDAGWIYLKKCKKCENIFRDDLHK